MPDFDARRLEAKGSFSYTDGEGTTHTMRSDDDGIVRPKNAIANAALEASGATIVRAPEKVARTPRTPRVSRVPRATRTTTEAVATPVESALPEVPETVASREES